MLQLEDHGFESRLKRSQYDYHTSPEPHQQHTEKYFLNLIKSTRNKIVFTNFQLIWNQTDVRLINTSLKAHQLPTGLNPVLIDRNTTIHGTINASQEPHQQTNAVTEWMN